LGFGRAWVDGRIRRFQRAVQQQGERLGARVSACLTTCEGAGDEKARTLDRWRLVLLARVAHTRRRILTTEDLVRLAHVSHSRAHLARTGVPFVRFVWRRWVGPGGESHAYIVSRDVPRMRQLFDYMRNLPLGSLDPGEMTSPSAGCGGDVTRTLKPRAWSSRTTLIPVRPVAPATKTSSPAARTKRTRGRVADARVVARFCVRGGTARARLIEVTIIRRA